MGEKGELGWRRAKNTGRAQGARTTAAAFSLATETARLACRPLLHLRFSPVLKARDDRENAQEANCECVLCAGGCLHTQVQAAFYVCAAAA